MQLLPVGHPLLEELSTEVWRYAAAVGLPAFCCVTYTVQPSGLDAFVYTSSKTTSVPVAVPPAAIVPKLIVLLAGMNVHVGQLYAYAKPCAFCVGATVTTSEAPRTTCTY